MRSFGKVRIRSIGGLVGVAVAVAGGFGAAVGFYSLPDPRSAAVGAGVYANAAQRAVAAATLRRDQFGFTNLRIEVVRGLKGARGGASGMGSDWPRSSLSHGANADVGTFLHAEVLTCDNQGGCFTEQQWDGSFPLDAFELSPQMDGAHFSGEAEGCAFDVVWTGEGLITPFEGHHLIADSELGPAGGTGPWRTRQNAQVGGFAEISRVAPAHIEMTPSAFEGSCTPYVRDRAPGYLSQGAGATTDSVGAQIGDVDP